MTRTNRNETYSSLGVAIAFLACLALIFLMRAPSNPSLCLSPATISVAMGQTTH